MDLRISNNEFRVSNTRMDVLQQKSQSHSPSKKNYLLETCLTAGQLQISAQT